MWKQEVILNYSTCFNGGEIDEENNNVIDVFSRCFDIFGITGRNILC